MIPQRFLVFGPASPPPPYLGTLFLGVGVKISLRIVAAVCVFGLGS